MSKMIEIPLTADTDATALMARARGEAKSAGIVLEGDDQSGRFRGTADGNYRVEGTNLFVEVTNKPAFAPWGMVESAIRKVFA
jgi:hypothetical protein